jgi:hypothetical protein
VIALKNDLKNAFDKIHADEAVKKRTLDHLMMRISENHVYKLRRFAAYLCVFIAVFTTLVVYFTPHLYIDLDLNPAVGFTLNRFDRVIETRAFNEEGERVLSEANVKHMTYQAAMVRLIDKFTEYGYLKSDVAIQVSVQGAGPSQEDLFIRRLKDMIQKTLSSSGFASTPSSVIAVTEEVRVGAYAYHMSPSKYIAISELRKLDPSASYEGWDHYTVEEIRTLIENHLKNK